MTSPIGELVLAACDDGLLEVRLPAPSTPLPRVWATGVEEPVPGAPAFVTQSNARRACRSAAADILAAARQQLDEYFVGRRRAFALPLSVTGAQFDRSVWEALGVVAYGDTVTYGQLARSIGHPQAARAVGAALGRNPLAIVVPCHRVVAAGGRLGGFAGGIARKRFLLDRESNVLFRGTAVESPASRACRPKQRMQQSNARSARDLAGILRSPD
jgi:methylated-DNA-[protein]-cysteine S-methyltransferase